MTASPREKRLCLWHFKLQFILHLYNQYTPPFLYLQQAEKKKPKRVCGENYFWAKYIDNVVFSSIVNLVKI